jgi:hypothetical protein
MRRSAGTALSALTRLDPLRSAGPEHRTPDHNAAAIDLQIARILAVPRHDGHADRTKPDVVWLNASHHHRPRYGALGLVTSAALAMIATLLWVSPSAGAPTARASGLLADPAQSHLTAAGSLATNTLADKRPLSATGDGTAVGR